MSAELFLKRKYIYCNGNFDKKKNLMKKHPLQSFCWFETKCLVGDWFKGLNHLIKDAILKRISHPAPYHVPVGHIWKFDRKKTFGRDFWVKCNF